MNKQCHSDCVKLVCKVSSLVKIVHVAFRCNDLNSIAVDP